MKWGIYYLNEWKRDELRQNKFKKIKFMIVKCMLSWFNALREKRSVYFDNHLTLFSAFNHQKIISRQSILLSFFSLHIYAERWWWWWWAKKVMRKKQFCFELRWINISPAKKFKIFHLQNNSYYFTCKIIQNISPVKNLYFKS